jgi:predicted nucleotide-binding protein
MARKNTPSAPQERPKLRRPKGNAHEFIRRQLDEGENLLESSKTAKSPTEFAESVKLWRDYTSELLRDLFTTDAIAHEFDPYPSNANHPNAFQYLKNLARELDRNVVNLRSIFKRIELFEETGVPTANTQIASPTPTRDVFVVHGRDEGAKHSVARFLEKLRLHPIILHEQPDRGRTVIEKFEQHSSVSFAVVLLTPDDEGRLRGADQHELRARQNVVLELGYFIGKLGRNKVCALKVANTEAPSDVDGVIYVPFDDSGTWKLLLARELRAAGVEVDLNLAM